MRMPNGYRERGRAALGHKSAYKRHWHVRCAGGDLCVDGGREEAVEEEDEDDEAREALAPIFPEAARIATVKTTPASGIAAGAGAAVAGRIMQKCGYSEEEIKAVEDAITGHREEKEGSLLNNLLYAADKLSRNCFCCKAYKECKWSENRKNKGVV